MPSPIKVTLDASALVYNRGVSRYTSNLLRVLNGMDDLQLKVIGYSLRQIENLTQEIQKTGIVPQQVQIKKMPPLLVHRMNQWNLPSFESQLSFPTDVYHAWEEIVPFSHQIPVVATIHDLAILKFPETAHPLTLEKHRLGWKRLKKMKSQVIAVSEATKKDLTELLDFPEEAVTVIHEAVPVETQLEVNKISASQTVHDLGIQKPFFLFVGSPEPRKNLSNLYQAWLPFKKETDLVVVGSGGWGVDTQIFSEAKILPKISQEQLAHLYSGAIALAYVSLYEGFALPILESYYYKTPVVTSNVSAMPEVGGTAAIYVSPLEVGSIQQGLQTVLDLSAKEKIKVVEHMQEILGTFSWEKVREDTVKVYKKSIQ